MNPFSTERLPSDVLVELADRLKGVRKYQKISQKDLAQRSGVSLGSLKRFESSGQISLESLLKLAYVLERLDEFQQLFQSTEKENDVLQLFSKKMNEG